MGEERTEDSESEELLQDNRFIYVPVVRPRPGMAQIVTVVTSESDRVGYSMSSLSLKLVELIDPEHEPMIASILLKGIRRLLKNEPGEGRGASPGLLAEAVPRAGRGPGGSNPQGAESGGLAPVKKDAIRQEESGA